MDLINDLGTDLALAFLVERRFRQRIDAARARAIIDQVRVVLESPPANPESDGETSVDEVRTHTAH